MFIILVILFAANVILAAMNKELSGALGWSMALMYLLIAEYK